MNKFTVAAGTFTLNKSSTSPSSDIPLGGTGVVLAKWDAKAAGEDMEIRQIAYTVSSSGAIKPTGTVKLQMDDGTVVYSIAGSSITLGSATTVSLKPLKEPKVMSTAVASKPQWTMQSRHFSLPLFFP